ncbi:MAG: hypothetical protein IKX47_00325 [Oscillospiraceae bacterium]|nr:hypothetical protein [Oscillospiraceae bacterium]
MLVRQIQQLLEARILCGEELLEEEISSIFASDMMSDILACPDEIECMLTGQVNQQVIRTADMMDIPIIIFVRDKNPQEDVITMATQRGMAVLVTPKGMYKACGILYSAGFDGGVD